MIEPFLRKCPLPAVGAEVLRRLDLAFRYPTPAVPSFFSQDHPERGTRWGKSLLIALMGHGLLVFFAPKAKTVHFPATRGELPVEVEVEWEPARSTERAASERKPEESAGASVSARQQRAASRLSPTQSARATDLSTRAELAETDLEMPPLNSSPGAPSPEVDDLDTEEAPPSISGRRLSLAELGIGKGAQVARVAAPRLEDAQMQKKRLVEQRLQQTWNQGVVDSDAAMGLGPQGEVRGALLRATREAHLDQKSSARLRVLLGQGGAVDTVTVLSSNSVRDIWNRIAGVARAKLAAKKLILPSTARGAELRFLLEHDFLLPSGRARHGRQKDPYVKDFSGNLTFDVADIGQDAQPIVRARLEHFRVF